MTEQLILVFYIDRETLSQQSLREEYFTSIRKYFNDLGQDPAIFFFPVDDGVERLECINPKYIEDQDEISKLKKMLSDVEKIFQIGNLNDDSKEYFNTIDSTLVDLESEEDRDDPLDIEYSDLTEDMRNKIAYWDKKYMDYLNPTEMAVHIEPNSKKGCLFNTFFHHKELIKESVLNQDLFELIDFIGDTELIVVPNLPAFMFDGKVYVAKNKSFTSKADVMSFILSMEKTFAIYSIILEQHVIYNPITFEETDKKQEYYTIQWSPLEN